MSARLTRAQEIGAALTIMDTELPTGPQGKATHGNALVDAAKRLQRLQTRAAKQRRALKATQAEIRQVQREVRALCRVIKGGE